MNAKQFQRYLDRDGGCVHCGDRDTAVPQHRLNRGMGGSKVRDVPSNIIVLCAVMNGLIESDAATAAQARSYGWKLTNGQKPAQTPFYDVLGRVWWLLDDQFGRTAVKAGV